MCMMYSVELCVIYTVCVVCVYGVYVWRGMYVVW